MARLTVTIRTAWWLRIYIQSVVVLATLTGMEPDMAKVSRWISRGIRIDTKG